MRIGIVTGEYPPMQGGVGAFSHILAQTLCAQGHDVFILSGPGAQATDGIPLTVTRSWGFGSGRAVNAWAKEQKLEVVNLQFQTAAFGMSPWIHFLPGRSRVPVVTTFHDLRFPYLFPKAGLLRDWIVMHLAKTSAGTIVTNHEDYERVKSLPQATIIPIGSNILTDIPRDYDRNLWRERAGTSKSDFLLAHFGFVNRSKGIDTLLESMVSLRGENLPVKLVMIGGRTGTSDPTNAAYADEIDLKIKALGLADAVRWTGFVTDADVSAYFHAADAVVLPFLDGASYRRGSLMAAVHHDCAIVTTLPQVTIPTFVDGGNMLLVPPGDSIALTAAIKKMVESSLLRKNLQRGAAALKEQFDWPTIAGDTATFFAQVTGANR